ncbi:hypothetical protein L226DRAFT_522615 [Lentinus tigrinus ALCF2SS1-7]|uniref:uncharacterized protein n=1 Tax=Lentinus tigrinus ALCF2SS1-7 TaxID=1328758 RepID=UPI0011663C7E|nr:hypothetical protein L226DRAFT_522615 [Lentinus tigrinus ALCF2SS1-7]
MDAVRDFLLHEPTPGVWEDHYVTCVREGRRQLDKAVSDLESVKEAGTESSNEEVRRFMDRIAAALHLKVLVQDTVLALSPPGNKELQFVRRTKTVLEGWEQVSDAAGILTDFVKSVDWSRRKYWYRHLDLLECRAVILSSVARTGAVILNRAGPDFSDAAWQLTIEGDRRAAQLSQVRRERDAILAPENADGLLEALLNVGPRRRPTADDSAAYDFSSEDDFRRYVSDFLASAEAFDETECSIEKDLFLRFLEALPGKRYTVYRELFAPFWRAFAAKASAGDRADLWTRATGLLLDADVRAFESEIAETHTLLARVETYQRRLTDRRRSGKTPAATYAAETAKMRERSETGKAHILRLEGCIRTTRAFQEQLQTVEPSAVAELAFTNPEAVCPSPPRPSVLPVLDGDDPVCGPPARQDDAPDDDDDNDDGGDIVPSTPVSTTAPDPRKRKTPATEEEGDAKRLKISDTSQLPLVISGPYPTKEM